MEEEEVSCFLLEYLAGFWLLMALLAESFNDMRGKAKALWKRYF